MNQNDDYQIVLKLLLLGDTQVGKTSIITKYVEDKFEESALSTVGVDYKFKIMTHKNLKIKLQIWDTSGEERFRSIAKNFYRNTEALFIVFDLTNKKTFDNVKNWISEAKEHNQDIKMIIIGNKSDLKEKIVIKKETAQKLANENKIKYFETSAKDGTNIKESFTALIDSLLDGKTKEEILYEFAPRDNSLSITSHTINEGKKKKCC